jgi:hypothetical protein
MLHWVATIVVIAKNGSFIIQLALVEQRIPSEFPCWNTTAAG